MEQENKSSSVGPIFAVGANGEKLQINPVNGASMVIGAADPVLEKPELGV